MDFCIKLEKITKRTFALNWKIIEIKRRKKEEEERRRRRK